MKPAKQKRKRQKPRQPVNNNDAEQAALLNLAFINIHGQQNKILEISALLNGKGKTTIKTKPDLIAINESWETTASRYSIPNFTWYGINQSDHTGAQDSGSETK